MHRHSSHALVSWSPEPFWIIPYSPAESNPILLDVSRISCFRASLPLISKEESTATETPHVAEGRQHATDPLLGTDWGVRDPSAGQFPAFHSRSARRQADLHSRGYLGLPAGQPPSCASGGPGSNADSNSYRRSHRADAASQGTGSGSAGQPRRAATRASDGLLGLPPTPADLAAPVTSPPGTRAGRPAPGS
jgi:hypothetical protein